MIILGRVIGGLSLAIFIANYIMAVWGFITDGPWIINIVCGAINLIGGVECLKMVRKMEEQEEKEDGLHRQSSETSDDSTTQDPNSITITGATTTGALVAHQAAVQAAYQQAYQGSGIVTGITSYGGAYGGGGTTTWASTGYGHAGVNYVPSSVPNYSGWSVNLVPMATAQLAPEYNYKAIPYEGMRPGEIIAYRCWPIRRGFLWSTAAERAWAPNEPMEAEDGHLEKGLGVYAFKSMSRVVQDFGMMTECAFGTVELWGEVVEHEVGYRAQYARIRSIDFVIPYEDARKEKEKERLRKLYNVENPDASDATKPLRGQSSQND